MVVVSNAHLVINSKVAVTRLAATTSSQYWLGVPRDKDVAFVLTVTPCSAAVDWPAYVTVTISSGNQLASVGHLHFGLAASSSEEFSWGIGPFESMKYGIASTSTAYGTEVRDNYIKVSLTGSSSSGMTPESTGTMHGTARLIAFEMPHVDFSS